jgi:hypothetical protein
MSYKRNQIEEAIARIFIVTPICEELIPIAHADQAVA